MVDYFLPSPPYSSKPTYRPQVLEGILFTPIRWTNWGERAYKQPRNEASYKYELVDTIKSLPKHPRGEKKTP